MKSPWDEISPTVFKKRTFALTGRGFRISKHHIEDMRATEFAALKTQAGIPADLAPVHDAPTDELFFRWRALNLTNPDDYEWIFDRPEFEPV
jgi:hypothetical protein